MAAAAAPDLVVAALRVCAFVLIFQAAGAVLFLTALATCMRDSLGAVRRLGAVAAWAALAVVCGEYLLEAARMSGDFAAVLDGSLQRLVMLSSSGASFAARAAGLAFMGVALLGQSRRLPPLGLLGVVLSGVAFTLTGHTSMHENRLLLAPALLIHVWVGMFWFGSLGPLLLVCVGESTPVAGAVIAKFSAIASWLVPCLLVAGLAMSAALLPGLEAFGQTYGQLLIVKFAIFMSLLALGAVNRFRYGPGVTRGDPRAVAALQRAVGAEIVLMGTVLAVTACLTLFFAPD